MNTGSSRSMPTVQAMVGGWKSHFWAADHEIKWLDAERPMGAWLSPNTLLVGVVDAIGIDAGGKHFFGEWKTSSTFTKKSWKEMWRKNPQSLTYGVLLDADGSIGPAIRRFTVRKAFKESIPSYDHAWYSYEPLELAHWRTELLGIAEEIRGYEGRQHWPTNFARCFQYGLNYVCPFFKMGCDRQDWGWIPEGAISVDSGFIKPRGPDGAVKIMQEMIDRRGGPPFKQGELVVLSASQTDTWLGCRERFRKEHVIGVRVSNEALEYGGDFHEGLGSYYKSMIGGGQS